MQFTAFGLLALASLAIAQDSAIPACAQPCIADAVKSASTCGASDTACQCKPDNVSKIQTAATNCVVDKCGIAVALTVQPAAAAACASLTASSFSTSSVLSSSAVAPSSSPVAPSSSTAAPSSAAYSSAVSSVASTPVSSAVVTSVTSGVASPTGSTGSNTTIPTTPSTSTLPYTGSGAQVKAGLGSALVIGVAAIFAF